jgi:trigger factor
MNIQVDNQNTQTAIITIAVEPADYKPTVERELKKYANKANVPGFRPGKTPMGMIKRMVGVGLVWDTVSKIINESLFDYLEDNKLDILGRPLSNGIFDEKQLDLDCKNKVEMSFEIGLAPTFELTLMPQTPIPHYHVEADEAVIEEEILHWRERFGESEQAEEVTERDWLYGDLVEVDLNGEAIEGGFKKLLPLNPARLNNDAFFLPFMGKKVGESTIVNILELNSNVEELKEALRLSDDEIESLAGKRTAYVLKRISRTKLAEMNADFYKKVFTNVELETEEAFRAKIKENLEGAFNNESNNYFYAKTREELLKINNFEMPDDFLKRWLISETEMELARDKDSKKERVTVENVEDVYEKYRANFRWEMIEKALAKKAPEILPTTDEVEEGIRAGIRHAMSQSGELAGMDEEVLYENVSQDKEYMTRQYDAIYQQKMRNYLETNVPHTHGHISTSDFRKLEW